MDLKLKDFKIVSLNIVNKNELHGEKTIAFHCNSQVVNINSCNYVSKCLGILKLKEEADNSENPSFYIEIEMVGNFSSETPIEDKALLARKCGDLLFPFLRAHIASSMASIGMPPIVIPLNDKTA